jgi:hypothetical protein
VPDSSSRRPRGWRDASPTCARAWTHQGASWPADSYALGCLDRPYASVRTPEDFTPSIRRARGSSCPWRVLHLYGSKGAEKKCIAGRQDGLDVV